MVDPEVNNDATHQRHIFVISGPAGCGKTSVAEYLQDELGFLFLEGDKFHTKENVAKMSVGQPLTDDDRAEWLVLLREQSLQALQGSSSSVVVSCSALKRKYRDVFRMASWNEPLIRVYFVFLHVDLDVLVDRVRSRQNHYMKDNMVAAQVECLEAPHMDELDVIAVDASASKVDVQRNVLAAVKQILNPKKGIRKHSSLVVMRESHQDESQF